MLDTDGVRTGQVALGNVAFRGRSPKFSLTLTQTNGEAQRFTISLSLTNITTPTTQHRPAYGVDGMMVKQVSDRSGPPDVGKRSRVLFQSPARVLYNSESYDEMTKCYKLPSVMIKACFSRGLLQSIPCSRQLPAPNFSVMLSLVGREARRSRGIHACGRSVTNSALQYLQLPRKSRGLSTSGSGISYGHDSPDQDVIVVDGVRVHDGATLATCGGWEAQRGSHPSKWETLVSVKMSETLAGVKQGTASLLQRWVPRLVFLGALPIALSAHYQSGLLPRSQEEEDEEEGETWGDAGAALGLFEGVWQTSVRRKRVSKMRKHKWRKRRRVERQSASRRVKN